MKAPALTEQCAALDEEDASDLRLIEEIFSRLNNADKVPLHAPLLKKSRNPKVLARLARIEKAIIAKARQRNDF